MIGYKKGQRVRVEIPDWLAEKNKLVSRVMEGVVEMPTAKAILFSGAAIVEQSMFCMRCKREITRPESRWCGFGPDCAEKVFADYPDQLSEVQIEKLREWLRAKSAFKGWLPIAQLRIEVIGDSLTAADREAEELKRRRATERVDVTVEGNTILVKSHYDQRARYENLPNGTFSKGKGAWLFAATPSAAKDIQAVLGDLDFHADTAFNLLLEKSKEAQGAAAHKKAEALPPVPVSKTDAWLHQRQAFWFANSLDAAMLALDMGTGKSKVAVDLVVNKRAKKVLVICPLSVVGVWPREFERHGGTPYMVVPLNEKIGTVKKKQQAAETAMKLAEARGESIAIAINYESAWRPEFGNWAMKQEWDAIIADESHRIKSPSGMASRFMAKLGRRAKFRLALTGTPMPHSPLDVFAQYRFLDPGIFGTSFTRFKNRYASYGGFGGYQVTGYQNQEELQQKFFSIAVRVMSDDVLDLPEYHHIRKPFKLAEKTLRLYKQLENRLYIEIGDSSVTASNALTKLLRLQQMTSGYVTDDDGNEQMVDEGKKQLLDEIVEDIGKDEPIVVFCRFVHDLATVKEIAEKHNLRYGEVSGSRKDLTPKGEMPDDVDMMAVQIQSGGVGVDLTRARYAIYYSIGFNNGDYLQSLKRVHRPGQTRKTFYLHLVAENTVDERTYAALESKSSISEAVLRRDVSIEDLPPLRDETFGMVDTTV